eukprot:scaffold243680_cov23-Tisochrysis_lutea.AAC.2
MTVQIIRCGRPDYYTQQSISTCLCRHTLIPGHGWIWAVQVSRLLKVEFDCRPKYDGTILMSRMFQHSRVQGFVN